MTPRRLDEADQATLRGYIRDSPSGEELARLLGLPASTLYAAAAGARLNKYTHLRVARALVSAGELGEALANMKRERDERDAKRERWAERAQREAKQ